MNVLSLMALCAFMFAAPPVRSIERREFEIQQGLEVGELEVDVEQLKKLLVERESTGPGPVCGPCSQRCGSRCRAWYRSRPIVQRVYVLRGRRCREVERCGIGATTSDRLKPRAPLRPTEIPLKLPVRLTIGMQQPTIEATRITRELLCAN